jgi:hypothetical protein
MQQGHGSDFSEAECTEILVCGHELLSDKRSGTKHLIEFGS